jgi:hypothetical protein
MTGERQVFHFRFRAFIHAHPHPIAAVKLINIQNQPMQGIFCQKMASKPFAKKITDASPKEAAKISGRSDFI